MCSFYQQELHGIHKSPLTCVHQWRKELCNMKLEYNYAEISYRESRVMINIYVTDSDQYQGLTVNCGLSNNCGGFICMHASNNSLYNYVCSCHMVHVDTTYIQCVDAWSMHHCRA